MVESEAIPQPGEVGVAGFGPVEERLGPLGMLRQRSAKFSSGSTGLATMYTPSCRSTSSGISPCHLGQHVEHARAAGVRLGGERGEDDRRRRELGVVLEVQVAVALEGLDGLLQVPS